MNVLVTGSKGQLGNELKELQGKYSGFLFFFTSKNELDITNYQKTEIFIDKNRIEVIINCGAYTDVDGAEMEPELADKINHLAVRNLAEISKKKGIQLIHISTDYVFDGRSSIPYSEKSIAAPTGAYGMSKMKGEQAILELNPTNSIILRTSWLYSSFGRNFVKTILKLSREKESLTVVDDQVGSPTYAGDLAHVILNIIPKIRNKNVEIYHYSNLGKCSWFEFADEIVKQSERNCKLIPISSKDFNSKVKRPKFSLLNTKKIQEVFKFAVPHWKESLKKCMIQLDSNGSV